MARMAKRVMVKRVIDASLKVLEFITSGSAGLLVFGMCTGFTFLPPMLYYIVGIIAAGIGSAFLTLASATLLGVSLVQRFAMSHDMNQRREINADIAHHAHMLVRNGLMLATVGLLFTPPLLAELTFPIAFISMTVLSAYSLANLAGLNPVKLAVRGINAVASLVKGDDDYELISSPCASTFTSSNNRVGRSISVSSTPNSGSDADDDMEAEVASSSSYSENPSYGYSYGGGGGGGGTDERYVSSVRRGCF